MNQRTDEWFAERLGKITGTRAADLMSGKKARETLLATIIRERLSAEGKEFAPTSAMKRGTNLEPEAIRCYELQSGLSVVEAGLIEKNHLVACSPDGLIGNDGGVEVKCLNEETHIGVIISDEIDKKYYWQIMWCMYVTGRKWWDYFGYCPQLPFPLTSYIKRIEITEKTITEITAAIVAFEKELTEVCNRLNILF